MSVLSTEHRITPLKICHKIAPPYLTVIILLHNIKYIFSDLFTYVNGPSGLERGGLTVGGGNLSNRQHELVITMCFVLWLRSAITACPVPED